MAISEALDMDNWVKTELYQDLIHMPLWTASAFEKDGAFYFDELRYRLTFHLIQKLADKCPPYIKDKNYIHQFVMESFKPLIRQAWGISRASVMVV
jgi:hypothetical protein